MSDETPLEKYERFRQAYLNHGEFLCGECQREVSLTDAEDIDEAIQIGKQHMIDEHGVEYD